MKEDEWMKIKGVNLGNWLVLEKWMSPALFDGATIKRIGLNTVGRSVRISEDAAMQDWEAVTALF